MLQESLKDQSRHDLVRSSSTSLRYIGDATEIVQEIRDRPEYQAAMSKSSEHYDRSLYPELKLVRTETVSPDLAQPAFVTIYDEIICELIEGGTVDRDLLLKLSANSRRTHFRGINAFRVGAHFGTREKNMQGILSENEKEKESLLSASLNDRSTSLMLVITNTIVEGDIFQNSVANMRAHLLRVEELKPPYLKAKKRL